MGSVKPDSAYHCRVDSVFEIYRHQLWKYIMKGISSPHRILVLKPAVVALGVPLYLQLEDDKETVASESLISESWQVVWWDCFIAKLLG